MKPETSNTATWMGFLVMSFAVVGLIGAFATFAAQLPFDRAMARSQALDAAIAASASPHPQAALRALAPLLGDSAGRLPADPGGIARQAEAERRRMMAEMHAESVDYGFRLRLVIAAFTAAAALFGCMVLSVVRRG